MTVRVGLGVGSRLGLGLVFVAIGSKQANKQTNKRMYKKKGNKQRKKLCGLAENLFFLIGLHPPQIYISRLRITRNTRIRGQNLQKINI